MNFEHWINRVARRLSVGLCLQTAAEWLAAGLVTVGAMVLIVRFVAPHWLTPVLWGALACGLALLLAAWQWALRRPYSRQEVVALIDQQLQAGGLLLTLAERPDEEWSQHLPQAEHLWQKSLPRLAPRRFFGWIGLPLAFFVIACLIPIRPAANALRANTTAGRAAVEALEELESSVEDARILPPQEQKEIREEIEKLKQEAAQAPLTHEKWELIDALVQKLQAGIELAANRTAQAQGAVGKLSQNGELRPEDEADLEQELVDTLQKLVPPKEQKPGTGGAGGSAASSLNELKTLQKQISNLSKGGAARQELLAALKDHLQKERDELKKLCKKCGKCQSAGDGEGETPEEGGDNGESDAEQPGQGGLTRGGGDAALKWGKEASEQGIKFRETPLPEGEGGDPQDQTLGVTLTAPETDPANVAARNAQRSHDPASGAEIWKRKFRPRHHDAIKQYFQ